MSKKKKKSNFWLYLLAAIVLIALIAGALYKNSKKDKGIKVYTENIKKRTIDELVSASGKVFPEVEINVSSDVSGELVELYVEEGDSVTAGQVLAKLDPELYKSAVERGEATLNNTRAQVATAKANLSRSEAALQQAIAQKKQLEAQLENTRAIFKRNEQLLKDGVISQADFDNAKSSMRSIEANIEAANATILSSQAGVEASKQSVKASEYTVQSAEATLKETKTSLNRTAIYAPVSGVVSYLGKEKGETVLGTTQMTGDIIFKIANLSNMEVQVDVSENDVLRVNLGDEVKVEVDAYQDKIFTGKVTEIANSANNTNAMLTTDQVTNFTVKIRIDRSSYQDLISKTKKFAFRPGMSASVDIKTESIKDVISVPIQAVTTRDLNEEDENSDSDDENIQEVVFILEADSVLMKEVETGIQDDQYIQILSGLGNDDEIISGPYTAVSKKLENGSKVEKTDKEDAYGKKKRKG